MTHEQNMDNPVIDEREDGIYLYFHDLPSELLDVHIDYGPPVEDEQV